MKFLIDANLSPEVAARLREAGHEADAVRDLGLAAASDQVILAHAASHGSIVVSHDTDFAALIAVQRVASPSLILIRSADPLTPEQQADLIVANLETLAYDLSEGAIAVFARGHLRVRPLPIN